MITPYWLILSKYLRFKTILDILIAFNEKYYDITIKIPTKSILIYEFYEFIKLDKAN